MATRRPSMWRQQGSGVVRRYEQIAADTIRAAIILDDLIWRFAVPGDNHVISSVRYHKTNEVYVGYSYRLRKSPGLRGPRQDILETRVSREMVQAKRNSWFFDPMTTGEERRVLERDPSTCAEHHAYNEFYQDRPDARPRDSYAVSVKYCRSGEIVAVERCPNCLLYRKAMGDVPTDCIHGRQIPLLYTPLHIQRLARVIMVEDLGGAQYGAPPFPVRPSLPPIPVPFWQPSRQDVIEEGSRVSLGNAHSLLSVHQEYHAAHPRLHSPCAPGVTSLLTPLSRLRLGESAHLSDHGSLPGRDKHAPKSLSLQSSRPIFEPRVENNVSGLRKTPPSWPLPRSRPLF